MSSETAGIYKPLQREDRLYTSESAVCRRQILTYKDGPHAERVTILSETCPILKEIQYF